MTIITDNRELGGFAHPSPEELDAASSPKLTSTEPSTWLLEDAE
ncbi:MAG: hypothetical protein JWL76_1962 [Thermoleophilia bacterium]|nr:hypothetical protein [Thermoleophilia bacterium]